MDRFAFFLQKSLKMLVILHPNTDEPVEESKRTWNYLNELPEIRLQKHRVQGKVQLLTGNIRYGIKTELSKKFYHFKNYFKYKSIKLRVFF